MKKSDLAKEIARWHGVDPEVASEQIDRVVNQIIRKLNSGRSARLPGLGTITPGKRWVFHRETK